MYGSKSDWVQNVLAAGAASVTKDGETFELESPQVISKDEAWQHLPDTVQAPPEFLNVSEYLRMDLSA